MAPTKQKTTYTPKRRFNRNVVGKIVRAVRISQDLTRDQFVARAQVAGWNISFYTLKRIENGEREVTDIELKKLARVLRVSPAILLK
jgi:transcriptional regulator with XRE-family HTH domain